MNYKLTKKLKDEGFEVVKISDYPFIIYFDIEIQTIHIHQRERLEKIGFKISSIIQSYDETLYTIGLSYNIKENGNRKT